MYTLVYKNLWVYIWMTWPCGHLTNPGGIFLMQVVTKRPSYVSNSLKFDCIYFCSNYTCEVFIYLGCLQEPVHPESSRYHLDPPLAHSLGLWTHTIKKIVFQILKKLILIKKKYYFIRKPAGVLLFWFVMVNSTLKRSVSRCAKVSKQVIFRTWRSK